MSSNTLSHPIPFTHRYPGLHKFGYNPAITTATDPEDVWDAGGVYPWPTAAAATNIVSTDADDTDGGSGARTVWVQGLDSDGMLIDETVTLNGTSQVNLTQQFYRVFRARVVLSGATGTNEGDIQIRHNTTALAQISQGYGQTLMAIYTVPANYRYWQQHGHGAIDCYARGAGSDLSGRRLYLRR